jgi:DNA polymerase-1
MHEPKKLVIIDGKSVFYRGYYAMPNLSNSQGVPTGGVYGFAVMALEILKKLEPDYVIVAWDKSKTNIRTRKRLYEKYKANRKPMPEDLRAQIPYLRKLLKAFSWPLLEIDDFEADDIMATLARLATKQKIHTTLVTSDLDMLQAIDGNADALLLKRGLTNTVRLDRAAFTTEYGMTPEQFIDYKALRGDSSDNVPGVAGVGDKTARQLVQQFGSLSNIYEHLEDVPPNLAAKLSEHKDMAYLSHKLLEIRFDVPIQLDLEAAAADAKPTDIIDIFNELEFKRLLDQLPESMRLNQSSHVTEANLNSDNQEAIIRPPLIKKVEIKTSSDIKKINTSKETVFYPILSYSYKAQMPELLELFISPKIDLVYKIVDLNLIPDIIKILQTTTIIGFDLKSLFKAQPAFTTTNIFDVGIAGLLLNPLRRLTSLEELVRFDLGQELKAEQDLFGSNIAEDTLPQLWQLYHQFKSKLKALDKLYKLSVQVEWPLVSVLAQMERVGIKLDTNYLGEMSKRFIERLKAIEEQVYKEAGQEFNIASPQQLQIILFDKLQLPKKEVKKTKTGYSTAASELAKLKGLHPIIDLISEFRELTKLMNTYIEPLPHLIDESNRLHTTFNQIGSQTGRLSSDHPNLMNIPVRTEIGREIRNAFIAGAGNVLISADYSQFELRLAAVLAGDTNMIHAFNSGIDVHTLTAAEMYDVEATSVTKTQRSSAKTVNFGVMYGLSPHGLSVATGMSMNDAKNFIKRYFEARKPLVTYLESLKQKAKKDGYVETLFGRRRPMPDIHSPNFIVRSAAERAAMNMPIQGTEADLMKMAMIKIQKNFDQQYIQGKMQNGNPKMLLQIHDSILVECQEDQATEVAENMKRIMENIYPKLGVKLQVDISIGKNWGEL